MSEQVESPAADQSAQPAFKRGEPVIYRRAKTSPHPGPRAADVRPTAAGEDYTYVVDKYWVVVTTASDQVLVQTRRGKTHWLDINDPNLRRPHWWERLLHRDRFPELEPAPSTDPIARRGE